MTHIPLSCCCRSGAYAPDDPLVQRLDRRIKECAALAAPA